MTMMELAEKESWMRRALELARKAWGRTHPNPMVGAVLVDGDRVLGEGYHRAAGDAHAEVDALSGVSSPVPESAVLFVTLEPCSTAGRTGPCTEAIRKAGVRRVVVGARDPNPEHGGKGIELLREQGIEVESGVLEEACTDLNLIFNHWMARGRPLVAGKMAMTLDGKIACRSGQSQWITGEPAREDVMRWRRLFPAIAVGAGTVLSDQPRLTSRVPGEDEWCPFRMVFDGLLRTANQRDFPSLYTDEFRDRTVVVTTELAGTGYVRRLEREGIRVWVLSADNSQVSYESFRERCRQEKIYGVYIEGGSQLLSGMLQHAALDYLFVYQAPLFFGDDKAKPALRGLRTEKIEQGVRLEKTRHTVVGEDRLCRGFVRYPEKLQVDELLFGHFK